MVAIKGKFRPRKKVDRTYARRWEIMEKCKEYMYLLSRQLEVFKRTSQIAKIHITESQSECAASLAVYLSGVLCLNALQAM